jgi:hypothetical protein
MIAVVVAVAGCDFQHKSTSTPLEPSAAIPSLLGTWSSIAAVAPTSIGSGTCTNFVWAVTNQTDTDIAGTFTAVCLGSANLTGNGTGHVSGSTVTISISGNGTMPGLTSCPFSVTGTGTIDGDVIRVPYSGSTCLGPVSGTQVLQRSLVMGPPQAAALLEPSDGATTTSRRPTLIVKNVQPQVPGDTMQYAFEVATDAAMTNRIAAATVAAGSGQTSYTVPEDLAYGTRYYWRAKTIDAGRSSSFSDVHSFVTLSAPAPPPTPTPSGGDQINMSQADIINNPPDLADWARTTSITSIDFSTGYMMVDFDQRLTGRWPESDFGVEYTLGLCFFINNLWHCSAVIQFWTGRDLEASGPASEIGKNWYYGRWGIMDGHQPAIGEMVGVFVAQGNLRDRGQSTLHERSNVVLIPFGTNYVR